MEFLDSAVRKGGVGAVQCQSDRAACARQPSAPTVPAPGQGRGQTPPRPRRLQGNPNPLCNPNPATPQGFATPLASRKAASLETRPHLVPNEHEGHNAPERALKALSWPRTKTPTTDGEASCNTKGSSHAPSKAHFPKATAPTGATRHHNGLEPGQIESSNRPLTQDHNLDAPGPEMAATRGRRAPPTSQHPARRPTGRPEPLPETSDHPNRRPAITTLYARPPPQRPNHSTGFGRGPAAPPTPDLIPILWQSVQFAEALTACSLFSC